MERKGTRRPPFEVVYRTQTCSQCPSHPRARCGLFDPVSRCLCGGVPAARRAAASAPAVGPTAGTLTVPGVSAPVRVVRDRWGVPHIYASTTEDLFFAQGFVQAEDRLFQMDLWRRASQGHLAEVLGSNFIGRDAMTRRMQYRGDLNVEWSSYGPDTKAIADAFVRGVNAWIAIARARPPEEFVLAGWLPEFWEPEDLLSRADGFVSSGNALSEVFRARLTAAVGAGPGRPTARRISDAFGRDRSGGRHLRGRRRAAAGRRACVFRRARRTDGRERQ